MKYLKWSFHQTSNLLISHHRDEDNGYCFEFQAGDSVTGAGTLQWIFPARIGTSLALVENLPYARGAITITPASRHIPEFEDHWVRIDDNAPSNDNPWYKSWYMEVHQCHLSGVTEEPYASYPACTTQSVSEKRASYAQDPYVEPAITAIFTFARALRDAQEVRCGTSSSGICNDLLTLLSEEFVNEYLKKASFTFINEERISSLSSSSIEPFNSAKRVAFDENGDLVEPSFDIWNYNDLSGSYKFEKVRYVSYSNGVVHYLCITMNLQYIGKINHIDSYCTLPYWDWVNYCI